MTPTKMVMCVLLGALVVLGLHVGAAGASVYQNHAYAQAQTYDAGFPWRGAKADMEVRQGDADLGDLQAAGWGVVQTLWVSNLQDSRYWVEVGTIRGYHCNRKPCGLFLGGPASPRNSPSA